MHLSLPQPCFIFAYGPGDAWLSPFHLQHNPQVFR